MTSVDRESRAGGRGGRKRPPLQDARAIARRLGEHCSEYHGGKQSSLGEKVGVPASTMTGWFSNPPRTPETAHLLTIGRATGVSLDWLLLGRGEQLFAAVAEPIGEMLREKLLAELTASEDAGSDEADDAMPSAVEVLRLSADAVRPLYRQRLAELRSKRWITELEEWSRAAVEAHPEWGDLEGGPILGYMMDPNSFDAPPLYHQGDVP